MLKKIFICICLISSILLVSCNDHNNKINTNIGQEEIISNKVYEIVKEKYTSNGITINYPQITDIARSNKNINQMIKNEALKILDGYLEDHERTIEIDYNVAYNEGNLLSIRYFGLTYVEGDFYPENLFYTTNINIEKEKNIILNDIININETFIEKFRTGTYKTWDSTESELAEAIQDTISGYTNNELVDMLNDPSATEIYFTKDSLGISIKVIHVLGDHAEIEMRYENIQDNIKKNEVWEQLYSSIFNREKPIESEKDVVNIIESNKGEVPLKVENYMYNVDEIKEFLCRSEYVFDDVLNGEVNFEECVQLGYLEVESNYILKLNPPYDDPKVLYEILSEFFADDALDYVLFLKHIIKVNEVYGCYDYSEDFTWFFDKDKEFEIESQDENNIIVKVPFSGDEEYTNYAQYKIEKNNGLLKIIKISFPEYDDKFESYKEYIKENAVFY